MSKKKEDPTKYEKKTGVIPEFYTKVRLEKLIHRTPSGVDKLAFRYRYRKDKVLPTSVKIGKQVLFRGEDVEARYNDLEGDVWHD